MFKWLHQYNEATSQTKYFVLNWLVHGLAIILTAIYCYARLDFVRSYKTPGTIEGQQRINTFQAPVKEDVQQKAIQDQKPEQVKKSTEQTPKAVDSKKN